MEETLLQKTAKNRKRIFNIISICAGIFIIILILASFFKPGTDAQNADSSASPTSENLGLAAGVSLPDVKGVQTQKPPQTQSYNISKPTSSKPPKASPTPISSPSPTPLPSPSISPSPSLNPAPTTTNTQNTTTPVDIVGENVGVVASSTPSATLISSSSATLVPPNND